MNNQPHNPFYLHDDDTPPNTYDNRVMTPQQTSQWIKEKIKNDKLPTPIKKPIHERSIHEDRLDRSLNNLLNPKPHKTPIITSSKQRKSIMKKIKYHWNQLKSQQTQKNHPPH